MYWTPKVWTALNFGSSVLPCRIACSCSGKNNPNPPAPNFRIYGFGNSCLKETVKTLKVRVGRRE